MLIAISGAQGQGKSTVLSSLSELGYNVIPQKTSRMILDEWGYSLNDINKFPPLKKKFQDELLVRQEMIEKPYIETSEIFFIERSYADIFAYTVLSLGPFNEYSDWLDDYYESCSKLQSDYTGVIFLAGRDYKPQDDGVRSINGHFSSVVDYMISRYTFEFAEASGSVIEVITPDHDERISEIQEALKSWED